MSEGNYINGKYVPWTTEHILNAADAEVGPGCCDESYQRLRTIMVDAPDLLEALEGLLEAYEWLRIDEWSRDRSQWSNENELDSKGLKAIDIIAKARGEKP